MGKTVKIIGGDYKGYEGILKSINNSLARIELSSKTKIRDPAELNTELMNNMNNNRSGSRTPSYYPKTANQNGINLNSPSGWNVGATRKLLLFIA